MNTNSVLLRELKKSRERLEVERDRIKLRLAQENIEIMRIDAKIRRIKRKLGEPE